jgi:hypothetical protein
MEVVPGTGRLLLFPNSKSSSSTGHLGLRSAPSLHFPYTFS